MILIGLAFVPQVYSQAVNATVSGKIVDQSGEPLIGAQVLIKNELTGFTAYSVTGLTGGYAMSQLPLGNNYTLTVSYLGYTTKTIQGIALNQNDVLKFDIDLKEQAQELSEIVVVSSSIANSIDRLGSSTAVTAKDMSTLPVNGRNFNSLVDLSPVSNGNSLLGQLFPRPTTRSTA